MNEWQTGFDLGSLALALASLFELVPAATALLALLWLVVRFWEYIRWVRQGRPPGQQPW